jgi:hypothetical protein
MTYEELIELCISGTDDADAITAGDEEARAKLVVTPEGLLLPGTCTPTEYCDDLRIRIDGDVLWASYRDSEPSADCTKDNMPVTLPIHGKNWAPEVAFSNFSDLSCWAYCL